jgi:hypothetical protein
MKVGKTHYLIIILMVLFLTGGTLTAQAGDTSPRTFAITDQHPYPGKFNVTIGNQPVNTEFPIYIYVVNKGGHFNPDDNKASAANITVTLYSETGAILYTKTVSDIISGVGYVAVPIIWPANIHVSLAVTGTISDSVISTTVQSELFWIGDPITSTPSTGLGSIIWEKEVL